MEHKLSEEVKRKITGRFIVLDGPDGCGKTTQVGLLVNLLLREGILAEAVRDPGGTKAGNLIREILLTSDLRLDLKCELLLFMASRAQLVAEKIKPALKKKITVISDRYISSTCAYQGQSRDLIDTIIKLGRFATDNLFPDLTIILDVPVEVGFARMDKARQGAFDNMEIRGEDFHKKVRETFLKLPDFYPAPVVIIDAKGRIEDVHQKVLSVLESFEF